MKPDTGSQCLKVQGVEIWNILTVYNLSSNYTEACHTLIINLVYIHADIHFTMKNTAQNSR